MPSLWKNMLYRFLALTLGLLAGIVLMEGLLRVGPLRKPCSAPPEPSLESELDITGAPCVNYSGWNCFDPDTGFWGRPNLRNQHYSKDCFDIQGINKNNFGVRDEKDYFIEKTPGRLRIAVLGDSMIEGFQVGNYEHFSVLLQKLLGEKVEVLNFAHSGYGTIHEYLAYVHKVRKFKPDIVLLAILPFNDIKDNHSLLQSCYESEDVRQSWPSMVVSNTPTKDLWPTPEPGIFYKKLKIDASIREFDPIRHQNVPTERLTEGMREQIKNARSKRKSFVYQTHRWLLKHSVAYCHLFQSKYRNVLKKIIGPKPVAPDARSGDVSKQPDWIADCPQWPGRGNTLLYAVYRAPTEPVWKEAWDATEKTIELLKKATEEDSTKLMVVVLTDPIQIGDHSTLGIKKVLGSLALPADFDPNYPNRRLDEFLKEHHIPYLNLLSFFREYIVRHSLPEPWFVYRCNGHYNPLGHYVAANEAAAALMENHWLDPSNDTLLEHVEKNLKQKDPKDILGLKAWKKIYGDGIYEGGSEVPDNV